MKGFIPKRNHTNANIATKVSQPQMGLFMKGFTQKRNHTNVNIATKDSHRKEANYKMGVTNQHIYGCKLVIVSLTCIHHLFLKKMCICCWKNK